MVVCIPPVVEPVNDLRHGSPTKKPSADRCLSTEVGMNKFYPVPIPQNGGAVRCGKYKPIVDLDDQIEAFFIKTIHDVRHCGPLPERLFHAVYRDTYDSAPLWYVLFLIYLFT